MIYEIVSESVCARNRYRLGSISPGKQNQPGQGKAEMAYAIAKCDGSPMDPKPASLSMRLMAAFKRPDDGMKFMGEIKALTDKDRADFSAMFTDAGYPVTAPEVKG